MEWKERVGEDAMSKREPMTLPLAASAAPRIAVPEHALDHHAQLCSSLLHL
jgi:hypothetical protein